MSPMADNMREIIQKNKNIMVFSGLGVIRETGLNGVRAEHLAYDTELKYGYSNSDIISAMFFARRGGIFFDYYRDVILNVEDPKPTPIHKGMAQLEEDGKLIAVATQSVYNLYREAGCEKVIALHGSVEENYCPACGQMYGSDFIKHSKGRPKCTKCQMPLRPGFVLLGERIDNGKMTQIADAVMQADVLLIIGSALNAPLCRHFLQYYEGNKLMVLNTEETLGDEAANYRLYGNLSELFQYITDYKRISVAKKQKTV